MAKQLWRKGDKLLWLPDNPGTLMYSEECCCDGTSPVWPCDICPLAKWMDVTWTIAGAASTAGDTNACACAASNGIWHAPIDLTDSNGCYGFLDNPTVGLECPTCLTVPPNPPNIPMTVSGSARIKPYSFGVDGEGIEVVVTTAVNATGGECTGTTIIGYCVINTSLLPNGCVGATCSCDLITGQCGDQNDVTIDVVIGGELL